MKRLMIIASVLLVASLAHAGFKEWLCRVFKHSPSDLSALVRGRRGATCQSTSGQLRTLDCKAHKERVLWPDCNCRFPVPLSSGIAVLRDDGVWLWNEGGAPKRLAEGHWAAMMGEAGGRLLVVAAAEDRLQLLDPKTGVVADAPEQPSDEETRTLARARVAALKGQRILVAVRPAEGECGPRMLRVDTVEGGGALELPCDSWQPKSDDDRFDPAWRHDRVVYVGAATR
jgi:hypothetical protein